MQRLVRGLHSFQRGYFATHQQLFRQLATAGQKPETLFITCCDSRVVPTLITDAPPGELFIVRNIGNMVPGPDLPGSTAAAIEYAVQVLAVENIIICGHIPSLRFTVSVLGDVERAVGDAPGIDG